MKTRLDEIVVELKGLLWNMTWDAIDSMHLHQMGWGVSMGSYELAKM